MYLPTTPTGALHTVAASLVYAHFGSGAAILDAGCPTCVWANFNSHRHVFGLPMPPRPSRQQQPRPVMLCPIPEHAALLHIDMRARTLRVPLHTRLAVRNNNPGCLDAETLPKY
jgi:hypothetical protein